MDAWAEGIVPDIPGCVVANWVMYEFDGGVKEECKGICQEAPGIARGIEYSAFSLAAIILQSCEVWPSNLLIKVSI